MTKVQYVGFNGYQQCPINKDGLPKVIANWTSILEGEPIVVGTHRFVVVETAKFFKIYGVLHHSTTKRLHVLRKPAETDTSGSCDEYLITSSGTSIWKFYYENFKWMKCDLKFLNEEEKSAWECAGNQIVKFSFQQSFPEIILLSSNGSVWLLSKENELRLLFPYDLEKAIDISSGLEHSLILTVSGCVLSFGNGSRGQLGHGDLGSTLQPVQIAALEGLKITKIAAGGWHSCAITHSGDLYTWGWNNFGQLSAFENAEEIGLTALPVFVKVTEESEVKAIDVACGHRHTVVHLENGDLYSTGWNTYNQLGTKSSCEKVTKFTRCQVQLGQTGKIICGPWYTIISEEPK